MNGKTASLYVNGSLAETRELSHELPNAVSDYIIGGDARNGNTQYFKGTLYALSVYGRVKTAEEIASYTLFETDASALYSGCFVREEPIILHESDLHTKGEFIVDNEAVGDYNGIAHSECIYCGKIVSLMEFSNTTSSVPTYDHEKATGLEAGTSVKLDKDLAATPKTFEFTIQLSPTVNARAGVLFGNYTGMSEDQLNIEVYTDGMLRLWYKVKGVSYTCLFEADLRSEERKHIALVLDGAEAMLYVDGLLAETHTLTALTPALTGGFNVGADNRTTAPQLFVGRIFAVNVFADVRTAEEIKQDMVWVASDTNDLLYSNYFLAE